MIPIHAGRVSPCWGLFWRVRQIYCHGARNIVFSSLTELNISEKILPNHILNKSFFFFLCLLNHINFTINVLKLEIDPIQCSKSGQYSSKCWAIHVLVFHVFFTFFSLFHFFSDPGKPGVWSKGPDVVPSCGGVNLWVRCALKACSLIINVVVVIWMMQGNTCQK